MRKDFSHTVYAFRFWSYLLHVLVSPQYACNSCNSYWAAALHTNGPNASTTISFALSDRVTSFRVLVDAFSLPTPPSGRARSVDSPPSERARSVDTPPAADAAEEKTLSTHRGGLLGCSSKTVLHSRRPFYAQAVLPAEVLSSYDFTTATLERPPAALWRPSSCTLNLAQYQSLSKMFQNASYCLSESQLTAGDVLALPVTAVMAPSMLETLPPNLSMKVPCC